MREITKAETFPAKVKRLRTPKNSKKFDQIEGKNKFTHKPILVSEFLYLSFNDCI